MIALVTHQLSSLITDPSSPILHPHPLTAHCSTFAFLIHHASRFSFISPFSLVSPLSTLSLSYPIVTHQSSSLITDPSSPILHPHPLMLIAQPWPFSSITPHAFHLSHPSLAIINPLTFLP